MQNPGSGLNYLLTDGRWDLSHSILKLCDHGKHVNQLGRRLTEARGLES